MHIYEQYSNQIFKILYDHVYDKKITNNEQFDQAFYDNFYKQYIFLKPLIKRKNDIIYRFIKEKLTNVVLTNDNFDIIAIEIINNLIITNIVPYDYKNFY